MKDNFTGSCQCEHIKYCVLGQPLTLFNCHCKECQKQSASAFGMALWIKQKTVDVLSGKLKTWIRDLPSGGKLACDFCPICGTRIFHRHKNYKDMISIKPGTLDDTSWLKPSGHIWTDSAQTWFEINKDSKNYAKNPESYEELIKVFSCNF